MARLDFYTSLVLMTFGVGVLVESWRMPRYEHLGVNPYTVPGIVPGFLGVVLALFGLILLLRSLRDGALRPENTLPRLSAVLAGESVRRSLITLALTLGYAAGLVGRLPFWLATLIFVFLFIAIFEWREGMAPAGRAMRLSLALAQAALVAIAVTLVFERLFLVRLP